MYEFKRKKLIIDSIDPVSAVSYVEFYHHGNGVNLLLLLNPFELRKIKKDKKKRMNKNKTQKYFDCIRVVETAIRRACSSVINPMYVYYFGRRKKSVSFWNENVNFFFISVVPGGGLHGDHSFIFV